MTVEQLNIIITAQTSDFREKLAAVNETLRETVTLARNAAAAAAALTGAEVSFDVTESDGITPDSTPVYSAGGSGQSEKRTGMPSAPSYRKAADVADPSVSYADFEEYAAANVPELGRKQTLIGAVAENGGAGKNGEQSRPLEIHTTVELDGDVLGEAISAYNDRISRITDGFYGG